MLMNRGYADRSGTPVPDVNREKQSTTTNAVVVETWTPEQIQTYLAEKYGMKATKQ